MHFSAIHASSGVPQGSHLGPLLFCIYINDLVPLIKYSNILLYADDVTLYRAIDSLDDSLKLQNDLVSLLSWSRLNGLSLNREKCNIISFTYSKNPLSFAYSIDGANLERVDKAKDLGIIFDSTLTFVPHIEYIVSKSLKMLGFVKRVTADFRDINYILYLYNTLILTNMTYCAQIWSPFTNTMNNKLESVQHILLRYIAFKMHRPLGRFEHNYSEIAEICNLQTIKSLHFYHDCLLTYKIKNHYINSPTIETFFCHRHITYSLRNFRVLQETTHDRGILSHGRSLALLISPLLNVR